MDKILENGIRGRLDELKGLYAQFFLLMNQSMSSEPESDPERSAGLDEPVAQLMRDISARHKAFHEFLAQSVTDGKVCTRELRAEIDEFNCSLEAGLGSTLGRVQQAIETVGGARDRVKDDLRDVQSRNVGRRAYLRPANPVSTLLNSKV